jgi:hypothetical protein
VLGYEKRGLLLRSHCAIPLLICGDSNQSAQTDITLIQGSSTILLVAQEEKPTIIARGPEPQVIAEAIATFQRNNRTRAQLGLPELDSMTIPCITMIGTRPIFYLVPVTHELSEAVVTAQYSLSPTLVKKCVVASNSGPLGEGPGMEGRISDRSLSDTIPPSHSRRGPLVGLYVRFILYVLYVYKIKFRATSNA